MSLSKDAAASLIRAYDSTFSNLRSLQRWPSSYPRTTRVYTATYETSAGPAATRTLVIKTGPRAALEAEASLLTLLAEQTPVVCPRLLTLDHSATAIPSSYTLLSLSSAPDEPFESLESALPAMSPRDRILVELRLGSHLHALHALQNDWFGVPGAPEEWGECYSWQEAFSLLVETALMELEKLGLVAGGVVLPKSERAGGEGAESEPEPEIPVEALRRALGRAIGFFLFDDVEVPCLVWCGALEWASCAFIRRTDSLNERNENASPKPESELEPEPAVLAHWGGPLCLWGDPLLEGALRAPSAALLEGYRGSGDEASAGGLDGSGLVVFARQRTKRLWYTAYAALCALLGAAVDAEDAKMVDADADVDVRDFEEASERAREARKLLIETAEQLKDAPCY